MLTFGCHSKKEPGSFWVIHDLSYPKGQSVNDLIPQDITSVSHEDFDHVTSLVHGAGQGALIAKADIQATFRILPTHPEARHFFGFSWRGRFYQDNCLPMGCSLSCALFESFSSSIQLALIKFYGFSLVSHILDDFIFIGPHDSMQCLWQLDQFFKFSDLLGISIKHSKTVFPMQIAIIHGIEVDTIHMQAHLPHDKVQALIALLLNFSGRKTARLREWQSLIGSLSFACRAICPGHPFL